MQNKMASVTSTQQAQGFADHIRQAILKNQQSQHPFFTIVLKLENMAAFKKRRPPHVVKALFDELYFAIRKAVHQSQYVGIFQEGLGLVFDAIDIGQLDNISRRLVTLTQHTVQQGRYNDLTSQWTDIIYQFLWPNKSCLLVPKIGWAIYPRDGSSALDLINRALHHCGESHSV